MTTINNVVEYSIDDKNRETRHPCVRENVLSFHHIVWRWLCFMTSRYVYFLIVSSWGHDELCLFCINWDHVITVFTSIWYVHWFVSELIFHLCYETYLEYIILICSWIYLTSILLSYDNILFHYNLWNKIIILESLVKHSNEAKEPWSLLCDKTLLL